MKLGKLKSGKIIDLAYAEEVIKKNSQEIESYGKAKTVLFPVEINRGRRIDYTYLTTSK